MTEEHLQEDQRREAAAHIGVVERHPPVFRGRQASFLQDHVQPTTGFPSLLPHCHPERVSRSPEERRGRISQPSSLTLRYAQGDKPSSLTLPSTSETGRTALSS